MYKYICSKIFNIPLYSTREKKAACSKHSGTWHCFCDFDTSNCHRLRLITHS